MRKLAALVLLGYLVLLGVAMGWQDKLIFFPTRGGRVTGPGRDLQLKAADGVELHARYIEQPGARHTLLFLHGNAGNLAGRSYQLQQLAAAGAHVLALDYRGYGVSQGQPSEAGVYSDALAAYAWATAHTPAARQFPWLPVRYLVRTRFDNLQKIAKVRAPKLFIHSRGDELIPFEMATRLFEAAPDPKRALWLDHPGHNETFALEAERVVLSIRAFLNSLPAS